MILDIARRLDACGLNWQLHQIGVRKAPSADGLTKTYCLYGSSLRLDKATILFYTVPHTLLLYLPSILTFEKPPDRRKSNLIRPASKLFHRISPLGLDFRPYRYSDPAKLRIVCRIQKRDMEEIELNENFRRMVRFESEKKQKNLA